MKPKGWWKDGDFNKAKEKQKLGFSLSLSQPPGGESADFFQLSNVFIFSIFSGKTEANGRCFLYRLCQSIRRRGAGGSKRR